MFLQQACLDLMAMTMMMIIPLMLHHSCPASYLSSSDVKIALRLCHHH
jgi:hypothetical protein